MNHKPRWLLENCLCSGRRQTLIYFFCLVLHTSRLLMVCQLKRRQQTRAHAHPPRVRHQHQANAADASVRGGTAALFAWAWNKKIECSLPLARSVSFSLHCADEAGRSLVPSWGQEHGALIIIALIWINRERTESERDRPLRRAPSDSLVWITMTADAFSRLRWKNNDKYLKCPQDSFFTASIPGSKPAISFISQSGHKNTDTHLIFQVITSSNLFRQLPGRTQILTLLQYWCWADGLLIMGLVF